MKIDIFNGVRNHYLNTGMRADYRSLTKDVDWNDTAKLTKWQNAIETVYRNLGGADWKSNVDEIAVWEGGTSNDPHDAASGNPAPDSGGIHTNKGVIWPTFQAYAPKLGLPATTQAFLALTKSQAEKIYKIGYWDAMWGDKWPADKQGVIDYLAHYAWGSGPGNATGALQTVLNTKFHKNLAVDNGYGPATHAAALSVDPCKLLTAIHQQRDTFLHNLPNANYWLGWFTSTAELYDASLAKTTGCDGSKKKRTVVALSDYRPYFAIYLPKTHYRLR